MKSSTFTIRSDKLGRRGFLSSWMEGKRIRLSMNHINTPVLDYGCGSHAFLANFIEPDQYVGIDIQEKAIEKASMLFPKHKFCDPLTLDKSLKFKSIVCLAVLEHVKNKRFFIKEISKSLVKGGVLIISTPKPISELFHTVGGFVGFFSHRATEEHEKLLEKKQLIKLIESVGYNIILYKSFMLGLNHFIVSIKLQ